MKIIQSCTSVSRVDIKIKWDVHSEELYSDKIVLRETQKAIVILSSRGRKKYLTYIYL